MQIRYSAIVAAFVACAASAANFTVTNNNDSGAGSLRDAITQANASPIPNTVTFDPGVTGTIQLTSGQILISQALTVTGPGAATLAIDGNGTDRVFIVTDFPEQPCPGTTRPNNFLVTITGLTLKNGYRSASNSGGAIASTKSL